MTIYFSGAGGVGIGPLMEIAHDAGYKVIGSDREESLMTKRLTSRGLEIHIGQEYTQIEQVYQKVQFDWLVYSAALPDNHPELQFARDHNIHVSKRDEFLSKLLQDKNLQLIAVAGTHGKTTTTGLLVWVMQQLNMPISYSVGSTLNFAESGKFDPNSQYFVYECDEYDRNMLNFEPELTIITSLDYDHPDTYKNEQVYKNAFIQFIGQSRYTLMWNRDRRYLSVPDIAASYESYDELMKFDQITLPGLHNRQNAFLVLRLLERIAAIKNNENFTTQRIIDAINSFPGTARRFEKLADNLYSDYGHHPAEIAATLQLASELSDDITLVYQPHQNVRQHEVKDQYKDCMKLASKIYWLPTYLSREDPNLKVLTPEELSVNLTNRQVVEIADMNNDLWDSIEIDRSNGSLVLVMGAGSIDAWARNNLNS